MYFGAISDTVFNCNGCHQHSTAGAMPERRRAPGFFGGDGQSSFEGETQIFKVPHLRNVYQKVGMFGLRRSAGGGAGFTGDQVRGFGFLHDGAVDTLFRFHNAARLHPDHDQSRRLRERRTQRAATWTRS